MIAFSILRSTGGLVALAAVALLGACSGSTGTARIAETDSTRPAAGRTSTVPGYTEFYRVMRYNGLDQIVFCYPTRDPKGEAEVYGIARDLSGRPTKITRLFFGNPENRAEWTTMRIEYEYYSSSGQTVERRTYHDPAGAPIAVRGAYGEEILYKGGQLVMRRMIDQNHKPLFDVKMVIRSLYKEERPGTIIQEWFFGNGKQYFGVGTDDPGQPFGDMPPDAYFRRYTINSNGEVIREEVWGIEKRAIPYPGGELVRAYEHNACGQTEAITYLDEEGRTRPNSDGIAREKLQYDEFGRLAQWQAFGATGTPKARADGAAAMVFRYRDFDRVLIGIDRFDEAGDPLPETGGSQ